MNGGISARRLAEFVCRSGDLYAQQLGAPVDAEDGIRVQKLVQSQRAALQGDFRKEVSLTVDFELDSTCTLKGRADGILVETEQVTIEEYKCVSQLPDAEDAVDLGQALIYAGMWAMSHEQSRILVHLAYVHRDDLSETVFVRELSRAQAILLLTFSLLCYEVRMRRHLARVAIRREWANAAPFPYKHYRPGQLAIARRAYVAVKNRENLLLEAPTGSGKTMAILYPAVRAQSEQEQLFFLTNRNSGARAALDAVKDMDPNGKRLAMVELSAKEKVCFVEGMPCDPNLCVYAKGYFDRLQPAVTELLGKGWASRDVLAATARKHMLCPFELSLDTALWSDLIIGDYNYVFDPVVRLQRFNGHPDLHLLVDEAHNLSARAQDMLSVSIQRKVVKQALAMTEGALAKRIRSVDRALMTVRRVVGQGEHTIADVMQLEAALARLLDTAAELDIRRDETALRSLLFVAHRWGRSNQWFEADAYVHVAQVVGRDIDLRRVCLDPAHYINRLMSEHAAVIRFSGTVSPLPLYQRLHGIEDSASERGRTPFTASQVEVLIVGDISTYYQSRQSSLNRLAELVLSTLHSRDGRYLVALPSYAYLNQLVDSMSQRAAAGYVRFVQQPGLTNLERDGLLADFCAAPKAVLFVVMGGVFSESVDFGDTSLAGVILVGIGLPPPSLQRNLTVAYFDSAAGEGWGQLTAYVQPAMSKIVQAAGRLIRSPNDRGVICLVDPRFHDPQLQRFFPDYWEPRTVGATQVPQVLREFWDTPTIASAISVD